MTDSATPTPGTATSVTNTFTVAGPILVGSSGSGTIGFAVQPPAAAVGHREPCGRRR